ncbi:MAG: hypothetical protein WBF33_22900 [Candidatus Nitrosopolaris sp.]|jgi:hypothetical protein
MTIKTTPTDIRYEYMHIDMTNIFLNLFAKIISFTPLSSIIIYISSIILLWKDSRNMNRGRFVPPIEKKSWQTMFMIRGCGR